MRCGSVFKPGEVVLSYFPFVGSAEIKVRPAVVLFEQFGNIVVAGITSNPKMKGIPLTQKEGLPVDSVIKTNYIFTIGESSITKRLMHLSPSKRGILYTALSSHLRPLQEK